MKNISQSNINNAYTNPFGTASNILFSSRPIKLNPGLLL